MRPFETIVKTAAVVTALFALIPLGTAQAEGKLTIFLGDVEHLATRQEGEQQRCRNHGRASYCRMKPSIADGENVRAQNHVLMSCGAGANAKTKFSLVFCLRNRCAYFLASPLSRPGQELH